MKIIIPLKAFVLFVQICHAVAGGDECHNKPLGFYDTYEAAKDDARGDPVRGFKPLRQEYIDDTQTADRVGPAQIVRREVFKP